MDLVEIAIECVKKPRLIRLRLRVDFQKCSIFDEKRNLERSVVTPKEYAMHRLVIASTWIGKYQRHMLQFAIQRSPHFPCCLR